MAQKFQFKDLWTLLKETFKEWNALDPFRESAVIAYYTIFSLPGLLIMVIKSAGLIFGEKAVRGEITGQISGMIGQDAAEAVQTMLQNSLSNQDSTFALIVGVGSLIFGATGVFVQLQKSFNTIWEVEPDTSTRNGIMKLITDRATSFGLIMVIAFLLLISLIVSTLISTLSDWMMTFLPDFMIYAMSAIEVVVSLIIIGILFAFMFKTLPDREIGWKTVSIGGIVTAILFTLGKEGLSLYFGIAEPASTYGVAGSVVLILLWVSYACLILFFGAEFTKVYARFYKHKTKVSKHAKEKVKLLEENTTSL
ncbi:putative membrane protein [Bernardetia litoralis DSM 6794]|uniref:Putative membrane protein n=1 Tax=Bernardetia litoralis (strain ATCC 23117 / DSM 6794 / NBRC 15988 / NCIMB 1366 / Fx l1 / Sio-4) TaxID=880071 RepID=I4AG94_BERLS|nr:YihY/virulence factor BrkB family protein [Bernardetia litoralis]AFM02979.1 putative membrane protein [Bernardetia litoralis DSM 6794]